MSKTATKAEKARFEFLSRELGCIACLLTNGFREADVHHITDCGRRMGHDMTIGLCPHHHRGMPPEGYTDAQATSFLGPSLAISKRDFVAAYGSEMLLHSVVEFAYAIYQDNQWTNIPPNIRHEIRNYWRIQRG